MIFYILHKLLSNSTN